MVRWGNLQINYNIIDKQMVGVLMGRKYGKKLTKKVVDITCDVCEKSCKDDLENFEYALLESSWGYYGEDACMEEADYIVKSLIKHDQDVEQTRYP